MSTGLNRPPEQGMVLAFVVAQAFTIKGRGVVLTPGLPVVGGQVPRWRIGDKIMLRRPDDSLVESCIRGINIPTGPLPLPVVPILIDEVKDRVPAETQVWGHPTGTP